MRYRDIAPHETSICELLTREIARCDSRAALPPTPQPPSHPPLSSVLQQTSTAIQYHAKWFAPPALATLLHTAINVASRSTSTSDLYATLNLIDTIITYSLLPALLPAVRFISYTYYQGSRSNRHRKLGQHAWAVAQHILASHLGGQFTETLLDIVGDLENLRSKFNFGAAVGALKIIMDHMISHHEEHSAGVHPTQLLLRLQKAAVDDDAMLREQVTIILGGMLQDEASALEMEIDGALDIWLGLIERCIHYSLDKDALDGVFKGLQLRTTKFEARHQPALAQLFIEARRPLPEALSSQLLIPWQRALMLDEDTMWTAGYRSILGKLCDSSLYLDELNAFIDTSVSAFFQTENFVSRRDFVFTLETLIQDSGTASPAIDVLAKGLVTIFTHKTQKEKWEGQRNWLFPLLCRLSKRSQVITSLLLRVRADEAGDGYLESECLGEFSETVAGRQKYCSLYGLTSLSLEAWVGALYSMLRHEPERWAIYDALLQGLAAQIRNHALWRGRYSHINSIREALCDVLGADQFVEPPAETKLTKSYVVGQLLQILTAIMSYHSHLHRLDVKKAVGTIINVAGSRDHTVSVQCIHALTICCYELPDLMAGYMDKIIAKMTRMVTQRYLALYVLEFFAGLSRFSDLQDRLRRDDFKRIFGVCHSYLQSIRSTSVLERKRTPTSEQSVGMSGTSTDDMAQYVYALTHHIITFWYMALKREDRHGLKEYITSCLRYRDLDDQEHIEDQGLVTIDLMDRVDSEDHINASLDHTFDHNDGRIIKLHRVTGILLITTETALRTGRTIVTIRRPSGTAQRVISSHVRHDSANAQTLESQFIASVTLESDTQDYISVFPEDVTGRTYGKVGIPRPSSALGSCDIITLPELDSVTRAIQAVDRMSALDSHKAGIIYVGEEQTTEQEILLNQSGSPDYREFLQDMGSLRKLKNATFNAQGLDRVGDTDGEYTIVWNKDVTELVYHITTFMPNDPSSDDTMMTVVRKKSHIGNDFVNIIFNNSGNAFRFDTFPSAFNYVYIVISPSDRTTFLQAREITAAKEKKDRFYNVQVLSRPGFPALSSAGDMKVLSGASVGGYVRNLALNACVFSAMWQAGDEAGEYPSSWKQRLHMIRRLYNQHRPKSAWA